MPESDLERARRQLADRGYLTTAPGAGPGLRWRPAAAVVALAVAAALVTAVEELGVLKPPPSQHP